MKTRLPRGGVALVALTVVGLVWWSIFDREPRYHRKTVSEWFDDYCRLPHELAVGAPVQGTTNTMTMTLGRAGRELRPLRMETRGGLQTYPVAGMPVADPPLEALRAFGSLAVPYLVAQLDRSSDSVRRTYTKLYYQAPREFRRILPVPLNVPMRQYNAAVALSGLGTNAQSAIPVLVRLLPDADPLLRSGLIHALRNLELQKEDLTPALVELSRRGKHKDLLSLVQTFDVRSASACELVIPAATNSDPQIRLDALRQFERLGPLAASAVPVVIGSLGDPDREVRYKAAWALEAMGTNAAAAIPALEAARNDPETIVSNAVARALRTIAPTPAQ